MMDRLAILTERLKRYEKQLEENEEWMDGNVMSLPSAVQSMLLRGVMKTEKKVKELKVHVETEKNKVKPS